MHWAVAFWIFLGGFVIVEPSPYEFGFLLVLGAVMVGGLKLYRSNLPLLLILLLFTPFAVIAAFQATYMSTTQALIFQLVTFFLLLTAYVSANYVAEDPQRRMRVIMRAYTLTALISAVLGAGAYLHIVPGYDLFTKYGRAKAFFQDPNVYGPFLLLPAMYALQRIFFMRGRAVLAAGAIVLVLFIGVFVSFSRAAWASFLAAAILVFIMDFFMEAGVRTKTRMMLIAMTGAVLLAVTLVGLLSIPSVADLFQERAAVEQNYDSGSDGRFGRQGYAFGLALDNPLGIGPGQFAHLRIKEEPHDVYVNALHVYGWGGGLAYYFFVIATLWRAFSMLFLRSPNRLLMIPLVAVFIPLVIEGAIIDLDHWRHYYLIAGMIWGVAAGYGRLPRGEPVRDGPLI
jgi:O-antigen ligase